MIVDTTEEDIVVEDVKLSIERAYSNKNSEPQKAGWNGKTWFHGAQQVKTRVENLIGLAATTGKVESWVFDNVADRLIFDQEMRRRLEENSRFAIVKIGELPY